MDISVNDSVLDVGCGNGIAECVLQDGVKCVVGVDISEQVINFLNRYNTGKNVCFRCMDITKELPKNFYQNFDKIICMDVLEHASNAGKVIQFIFNGLKEGGSAFLTFPINNFNHGTPIPRDNVSEIFAGISPHCDIRVTYLKQQDSFIHWLYRKIRRLFPMRDAESFDVTLSFKLLCKQKNDSLFGIIYGVLKFSIILFSYFGGRLVEARREATRCFVIIRKRSRE
jgi:ubiquinone/menaquinone biosynthesis C-methylase UbiE